MLVTNVFERTLFYFFFAVNFWIPVEIRPERRMDGPLGWLPNDRSRKNKTKAQRKRFFNNKKRNVSVEEYFFFKMAITSKKQNKTKTNRLIVTFFFVDLFFWEQTFVSDETGNSVTRNSVRVMDCSFVHVSFIANDQSMDLFF